MAGANIPNSPEVSRRRRGAALCGPAYRLCDESNDCFRAKLADLGLDLVGKALAIGFERFVFPLIAIGIRRRYVVAFEQHRCELLPAPGIAADRQRTERVAVIALPARDEALPLRLASLDEILASHLECRFDRFRTARHEIGVRQPRWRMRDEMIREPLRRLRGEERAVDVGQLVELCPDRIIDGRVPVAEAGHGCATGGIDIGPARGVENFDAAATDSDGHAAAGDDTPGQDMAGTFAHDLCRLREPSVV